MATNDVLSWAERCWNGEVAETSVHPLKTQVGFAELGPGVGFMAAFANAAPIQTEEGLVLIDTSSLFHAGALHAAVRSWTPKRLHTAVYTHGHVDHVFGLAPFEAEGAVHVIAHRLCPSRFDRYRLTVGYNGIINARQFALPAPLFPGEFRYPDQTFDDQRIAKLLRKAANWRAAIDHDQYGAQVALDDGALGHRVLARFRLYVNRIFVHG